MIPPPAGSRDLRLVSRDLGRLPRFYLLALGGQKIQAPDSALVSAGVTLGLFAAWLGHGERRARLAGPLLLMLALLTPQLVGSPVRAALRLAHQQQAIDIVIFTPLRGEDARLAPQAMPPN